MNLVAVNFAVTYLREHGLRDIAESVAELSTEYTRLSVSSAGQIAVLKGELESARSTNEILTDRVLELEGRIANALL